MKVSAGPPDADLGGVVRIVVLSNGRETYEERDSPGIACRFPGTDVPDSVHYHPDTETVDVVAGGRFYSTRSILQNAESWIDDRDRLHVDAGDARVIVDPR